MSINSNTKISIIIPIYNEAGSLKVLFSELDCLLKESAEQIEIILVDDGSTDNSLERIRKNPSFKIVRHPMRLGYGSAIKTGLRNACGQYVVLMDGDGQHKPSEISTLIEALENNDLAVGVRTHRQTFFRKVGIFFLNLLASYLSGKKIPDLTSGFRAYKRLRIMEFIDLLPNGFSASSTGTLSFAVSGYPIAFVPVQTRARSDGKSKINFFVDGMRFLILILRIISLFNPLKIFIPISIILLLIGMGWTAKTLYFARATSPLGMAFLLTGFLSFMYGFLADQSSKVLMILGKIISRLEKNNNKSDHEI